MRSTHTGGYFEGYSETAPESPEDEACGRQEHAGWARVTFATLEDAERAVLALPGSDLLGSCIRAHYAKADPVTKPSPDPAAIAARVVRIATRKAQHQCRRARQVSQIVGVFAYREAPGGHRRVQSVKCVLRSQGLGLGLALDMRVPPRASLARRPQGDTQQTSGRTYRAARPCHRGP